MRYSSITKIAHVVDNRYSVKRNGVAFMFNVPNYPMDLIRNEVRNLRKCVDSEK